MKIGKLRKKLRNIYWVENKLIEWAEREKYWEKFYKFNCNSFFEGYTLAKLNKEKYERNIKIVERKIEQYEFFYNKIKEKV